MATQTPPIRSGRRVIFVTLDDATGPLDATFFEDAQVGYATTRLPLLAARSSTEWSAGPVPRGVSMQATGLLGAAGALHAAWQSGGLDGRRCSS